MDKAERNKLLERAMQTRTLGRARVESDYHETVKAIERVFTLSQEAEPVSRNFFELDLAGILPGPEAKSAARRSTEKSRGKSLMGKAAVVRSAIADFDEFTTPEIHEYIKKEFPSTKIDTPAISSIFNKLKKTGKIVQVSDGAGRQPHRYKKAMPVDVEKSNGKGG